ncbi:putative acyl carrier protein AcpP [Magnetospira sp. QH-2]|nr:putative acyl carrier protein AcpP [Magnetospira sp. QH-2]
MSQETMETEVRHLLAAIIDTDAAALTPEAAINSFPGWDSFAHMNIMMMLNETFQVPIDETTIIRCTSLSGILEMLKT